MNFLNSGRGRREHVLHRQGIVHLLISCISDPDGVVTFCGNKEVYELRDPRAGLLIHISTIDTGWIFDNDERIAKRTDIQNNRDRCRTFIECPDSCFGTIKSACNGLI